MRKENKTLHLFTAEFPYGNKSETFLEAEILFLAKGFGKVVIYPSVNKKDNIRLLPENVEINSSIENLSLSKKKKISILFKKWRLVIEIFFIEVQDKGFFNVLKNRKILLDYLSKQIYIANVLKENVKFSAKAVFYDYWFINSLLALLILKKERNVENVIARAHRFDLYDEVFGATGIPFRGWKIKNINKLFLISKNGLDYIKNKVKLKYHNKLFLSHLGVVKNVESSTSQKKRTEKLIVSCSSMLPFKQVDRIPQLLKKITTPIKWVHFGDGSAKEKVELALLNIPKHFSYELKGHVNNNEVLDFYKEFKPDFFISLSLSEGLPVSMMEAQSYGIPIFSYPVGGIPELVINGKTGQLIEMNKGDKYEIELLSKTINHNFEKNLINDFFNSNFNATVNYTNFVKTINAYTTNS